MKKYIIKNCPARIFEHIGSKQSCFDTQDKDERYTLCENVLDCPLKQIVEKCKSAQKTQWVKNKKKPYSPSKAAFAREVLKILEIEEVNDN